jgi:hypothetical protein
MTRILAAFSVLLAYRKREPVRFLDTLAAADDAGHPIPTIRLSSRAIPTHLRSATWSARWLT